MNAKILPLALLLAASACAQTLGADLQSAPNTLTTNTTEPQKSIIDAPPSKNISTEVPPIPELEPEAEIMDSTTSTVVPIQKPAAEEDIETPEGAWYMPYTAVLMKAVDVITYIPRKLAPRSIMFADSMHEAISHRFISSAQGIDKLLSRDASETKNKSSLDITLPMTVSENPLEFSPSIGCQIDLPKTEGKLKVIVQHTTDEFKNRALGENVTDEQTRIAEGQPSDGGTSLGLRYVHSMTKFVEQHFDAGLRYKLSFNKLTKLPVPFARTSLATSHKFGEWNANAFAQEAWNGDDWLELTSGLYFDRTLTRKTGLSFISNLFWASNKPNIRLYQTAALPIALSEKESLTPTLQVGADTYPVIVPTVYTVALSYRRDIYKHWTFINLTPAMDYPRSFAYAPKPRFTVSLEIYFGAHS